MQWLCVLEPPKLLLVQVTQVKSHESTVFVSHSYFTALPCATRRAQSSSYLMLISVLCLARLGKHLLVSHEQQCPRETVISIAVDPSYVRCLDVSLLGRAQLLLVGVASHACTQFLRGMTMALSMVCMGAELLRMFRTVIML